MDKIRDISDVFVEQPEDIALSPLLPLRQNDPATLFMF